MSLAHDDTAQLLMALVLLLMGAHLGGYLFVRLRQPRVIGEILGGLTLGPTVLGALAPSVQSTLFPASGATSVVLGAMYELGLVLLMFVAGAELRSAFHRRERSVTAAITLTGVLLPFTAGILVFHLLDLRYLEGPAHNAEALSLVFAAAIAVTSIPVISRIMLDLGVLDTSFARIVLSAAVMEDVALYAILAIAVGLAGGGTEDFGLGTALGIAPASAIGAVYYTIATGGILGLALIGGRRLSPVRVKPDLVHPVAYLLLLLLTVTLVSLALNVTPVFGGFAAGIVAGAQRDEALVSALETVKQFSFAFFIPIYFAIVGFRLDLTHGFGLSFFLAFLLFACAVKAGSVYLGARLAGEATSTSRNLAVAMNARGGPGIVLASLAFDAKIIGTALYAYLVVLSIATSLLAGSWLGRVVRHGAPLRAEPEARPGFASRGSPAV